MNWPAYPKYKDSGVQWLGKIPADWVPTRMDKHLRFVKDQVSVEELAGQEVFHYSIPNVQSRGTGDVEDGDSIDSNKLRIGNKVVLVSKLNPRKGTVCIATPQEQITVCSTEFIPLKPHGLDLNFLFYLVSCDLYRQRLESAVASVTRSHQRIDSTEAYRFWWGLPGFDDQVSIADFLDRETAKIDALIAKQEQLIATLREDRTATITHAVTKGLNAGTMLVQPVNDTLPSSPAHWTHQIQLKRVADVQTGLTLGKVVDPGDVVSVPYLRVANVQTGAVNLDEVKAVEVHRADVGNYLLRAGDVLMTEGGDIDKLGRGCLWSGEISPCIHQNHVFAVRCNEAINSRFLVYLLDTSVARNYFFMTAKKTTNLASTNSTTLGRFSFSLPPHSEQDQIVKFLDERCTRIDAVIAKSEEMIAILREYRSALITDAVTGKIDVRGVA